jgi:hypothetical protein
MRICRAAGLLGAVLSLSALLGCSGSDYQQQAAGRVNAHDKRFAGSWLYKSRMGEQQEHPVLARLTLLVDGSKFRVVAHWTTAAPVGKRGKEQWVSDGKHLWQLVPARKQVNKYSSGVLKAIHFWKMPYRMSPFSPAREAGEDGVAGKRCRVLAVSGKYDQGDVTLRYWIDIERDVLLKKEHLLGAGGLLLVHEIYECEHIDYSPRFSQGVFDVEVPEDWVEVEKLSLDSELLDTKF